MTPAEPSNPFRAPDGEIGPGESWRWSCAEVASTGIGMLGGLVLVLAGVLAFSAFRMASRNAVPGLLMGTAGLFALSGIAAIMASAHGYRRDRGRALLAAAVGAACALAAFWMFSRWVGLQLP